MAVVAMDPATALLRLQDSLDRLLRSPGSSGVFGSSRANVFPPLNVFADQESILIRAEVPGFSPDEIQVTVERRRLTISGERQATGDAEPARSYHRRERQTGKFSRSLQLPDNLDPEEATAGCRNGILTVRIPKQAEHKPRKISINQD